LRLFGGRGLLSWLLDGMGGVVVVLGYGVDDGLCGDGCGLRLLPGDVLMSGLLNLGVEGHVPGEQSGQVIVSMHVGLHGGLDGDHDLRSRFRQSEDMQKWRQFGGVSVSRLLQFRNCPVKLSGEG
jgi:hypothetical protein